MMMDDFYGDKFRWFVGVVKDIGDDRSRVRVRIFGIHHTEDVTKVSDGDLPWALVLYPTTGGQTTAGNASHNLMPGAWVVGFFCDGIDSQQPIVFGVINGGMESINSSPKQNTNVNPLSPNQSSSTPSSTVNDSTGSPTTTQLSGDSNVQKVYNYFWEKIKQEGKVTGDLKCIVAAICGNLQGESGQSIDPQAYNGNDKGEPSYGIAQWRAGKYDRYTPLLKFCGITAEVKPPNLPPLEKQLDFMWHELQTSERSAYNKLITSTTIQDAVAGMIYFERDDSYKKISGGWTVDRKASSYTRKLENARKILSSLSFTGTPSS
jgi:hypothetical protein